MQIYDSIPPGYYLKAMNEGWSAQKFWHSHKLAKISEKIPDDPTITIVDLGCGAGNFFFQHKKRAARKIGIDFAKDQIRYASKIMPDVEWICADIEQARLPKADYIIFSEVMEHLTPKTKIIQRINSSLNKKGKLVLTTPNYASLWPLVEKAWEIVSPVKYEDQHINPQTPRKLVKLVESEGFRLLELETIFLFSPFIAFLSDKLAGKLSTLEQKFIGRLGCIMVAVFEKT